MVRNGQLRWRGIACIFCLGFLPSAALAQVAQPKPATISGVILYADGSPLMIRGSLYVEVAKATTPPSPAIVASSQQGVVSDRFWTQVQPGTVWVKFFARGFAPISIGPLQVTAGQKVDNLRLVLQLGDKSLLRVVSPDGKRVPNAKISAFPLIGATADGPDFPVKSNDMGELLLEHTMDAPYSFRVTAPGYEPLKTAELRLNKDGATELTMTPSLPASGIVLNGDGMPAKGAKIRFRLERKIDDLQFGRSYGYGEIVTTTDDAGRFVLDQLTRDMRYIFVIEAADNSRIVTTELKAGVKNATFRLPKNQNLRVKIVGNIAFLTKSKEGQRIGIRQDVKFDPKQLHASDIIGDEGLVKPTDDGGVMEFAGLVSGKVIIHAGRQEELVTVVENGLTEVTINVTQESQSKAVPGSARRREPAPAPVAVAAPPRAPVNSGIISGVIVLEDGSPAKINGRMYSDLVRAELPPNRAFHDIGWRGEFQDKFSVQLLPGKALLKYFADGYAPVWVGPFDVIVGQKIDTVKIVLARGKKGLLRVVSSDGRPIVGATVRPYALINGDASTASALGETNQLGEHAFENLADVPYVFQARAAGYEPRAKIGPFTVKGDEATELPLTPSLPASATVFQADGKPAKGAKVYQNFEQLPNGNRNHEGSGFGKLVATTDAAGSFTLDELTRGSKYFFIVEAEDKARIPVRTITAGVTGVDVRLPKVQTLRVKLVGDLKDMQLGGTQCTIGIQHHVTFDVDRGYRTYLSGGIADVKPIEGGGVAEYSGLLSGAVRISAGRQSEIFDVVENGLTDVTIELKKKKTDDTAK